jgi:general secretion pathway protein A
MAPDPDLLFPSAAHRDALAGLFCAILGRQGFVVLTGEAGTGKTALLRHILQSIPSTRALFSVVVNPVRTPASSIFEARVFRRARRSA